MLFFSFRIAFLNTSVGQMVAIGESQGLQSLIGLGVCSCNQKQILGGFRLL